MEASISNIKKAIEKLRFIRATVNNEGVFELTVKTTHNAIDSYTGTYNIPDGELGLVLDFLDLLAKHKGNPVKSINLRMDANKYPTEIAYRYPTHIIYDRWFSMAKEDMAIKLHDAAHEKGGEIPRWLWLLIYDSVD